MEHTTSKFWFFSGLVFCFCLGRSPKIFSQSFPPERVVKDWEALTKNGGEWITHDNTGSYDAYGMKFTWGLGKKTVNGSLYAIKDGKVLGTIFEYKIYYHPIDNKVILEQFGSDGTVGIGEIILKDSLKSENISTFYNPDGKVLKLKHVQQIVEDMRTTKTYKPNDNGEWVEDRNYTWRRTKEKSSGED